MLRSVALQKVPDVLEVFAASIVKAYRLLMEAVSTPETSASFYETK
jgi:hypothetical protein